LLLLLFRQCHKVPRHIQAMKIYQEIVWFCIKILIEINKLDTNWSQKFKIEDISESVLLHGILAYS